MASIRQISLTVTIISVAITIIGLVYSKLIFKEYLKEVKNLNENVKFIKNYLQ